MPGPPITVGGFIPGGGGIFPIPGGGGGGLTPGGAGGPPKPGGGGGAPKPGGAGGAPTISVRKIAKNYILEGEVGE